MSPLAPDANSQAVTPFTRMPRPATVKRSWVRAWVIRSTNMLAPAKPPATPRLVSRRAPTTSPPTAATGSSVLMPSRTNRRLTQANRLGPPADGKIAYQPSPAQATAMTRAATTRSAPQPALTTAAATSSTPEERNRPTTVHKPAIRARVVRRFMVLFQARGWLDAGVSPRFRPKTSAAGEE